MRSNKLVLPLLFLLMTSILLISSCGNNEKPTVFSGTPDSSETIVLPEPVTRGDVSLEESLAARRSTRTYSDEPLSLKELSQLLWAAQGITNESGHRTAPSAVAMYPLTIYVIVGNVPEIVPGIYTYIPEIHSISRIVQGDKRNDMADAAMGQQAVREGAVTFAITADIGKMNLRLGDKGERFTLLEAGHVAQSICLQATALDFGVVTIGLIDDDKVGEVLDLPTKLNPLYILPVGRK